MVKRRFRIVRIVSVIVNLSISTEYWLSCSSAINITGLCFWPTIRLGPNKPIIAMKTALISGEQIQGEDGMGQAVPR